MIYISHRGNVSGVKPDRENSPDYIDEAIHAGFDVEVDLWEIDSKLLLGHDVGQYETTFEWLYERSDHLWIHCKNIKALQFFNDHWKKHDIFNYFFHEEDQCSVTDFGYIWAHPKIEYNPGVILVDPGRSKWTFDQIMSAEGICDDYVSAWKNSQQ